MGYANWDIKVKIPSERILVPNYQFSRATSLQAILGVLKSIDIDSEQEAIKYWLETIMADSPLPTDATAFWIGIIKVLGENNNEIPAIYLVGAGRYDEDNVDWACDPIFLPDNRYACPELLKEIDDIIKA